MSQSAESIYSNSRWLSGACCGFKQAPLDVWGNWRNKSKNADYLISHDEGDSRWTKYEVLSVNLRLPAMNTHSTGVSFRPFKVCLFFEFHIVNIAETATSVESKTNLKKKSSTDARRPSEMWATSSRLLSRTTGKRKLHRTNRKKQGGDREQTAAAWDLAEVPGETEKKGTSSSAVRCHDSDGVRLEQQSTSGVKE